MEKHIEHVLLNVHCKNVFAVKREGGEGGGKGFNL